MSTRRRLACLALALALASCGGRTRTPVGERPTSRPAETQARPAIEAKLPLLRWVPADAELVITAESLRNLEQFSAVVAPISAAFGLSSEQLFASEWLRRGVDLAKPVAISSRGTALTLLAHVSGAGEPLGEAWWQIPNTNYAAAHWDMFGAAAQGDWTAPILAAGSGTAFSSSPLASALAETGAVRAQLPLLPLLAAAVGGADYLSCLPLLRAAGSLQVRAGFDASGTAWAEAHLPLSAEARAEISSVLGPGVRPGIVALRQSEAAHLSVGLDPAKTAEAFRAHDCPELAYEVDELVGKLPMRTPPRGFHIAGTRFQPSNLSGQVALQVPLRNRRFIASQLNQIPGRSFFESTIRIGAHKAKKLSVPTMSSLYYWLSDSEFLFATKKDLMGAILATEAAAPGELAAVGLWPARFPQLKQYLRSAMQRDVADAWHALLLRFEFASSAVVLREDGIHIELRVRAAR